MVIFIEALVVEVSGVHGCFIDVLGGRSFWSSGLIYRCTCSRSFWSSQLFYFKILLLVKMFSVHGIFVTVHLRRNSIANAIAPEY
jgi:hypothetical protein